MFSEKHAIIDRTIWRKLAGGLLAGCYRLLAGWIAGNFTRIVSEIHCHSRIPWCRSGVGCGRSGGPPQPGTRGSQRSRCTWARTSGSRKGRRGQKKPFPSKRASLSTASSRRVGESTQPRRVAKSHAIYFLAGQFTHGTQRSPKTLRSR